MGNSNAPQPTPERKIGGNTRGPDTNVDFYAFELLDRMIKRHTDGSHVRHMKLGTPSPRRHKRLAARL